MSIASVVYRVGSPIAIIAAFQYFFPGVFSFITPMFFWLYEHIQWNIGMDLNWPLWYKIFIFTYANLLIFLIFITFIGGLAAAWVRNSNNSVIACLAALPWLFALFLALFVQF